LRPTPRTASSARNPAGARPLARLFFGYFLLAKQKKVTRPTGRNLPWNPCLSFAHLFFGKAKKSEACRRQNPCNHTETLPPKPHLSFAYFSKKVRPTAGKKTSRLAPAQALGVQALDVQTVGSFGHAGRFGIRTARILHIDHHFAVFGKGHDMAISLGDRPQGAR